MTNAAIAPNANNSLPSAARFWEPGRLLYNAILAAIVLLWLVLTWPHFRPALTLDALVAMTVLGLLANLCYCAAYPADLAMQRLVPSASLRRARQALWVLGMLLAVVVANYWIADEIYPDATNGGPHLFKSINTTPAWPDRVVIGDENSWPQKNLLRVVTISSVSRPSYRFS